MSVVIKLNEKRTHTIKTAIPAENGEIQTFDVEYRIPLAESDKDALIFDLIVGVKGLSVNDENGNELSESELIDWLKTNPWIRSYLASAYNLGNQKNLEKSQTFLRQ